MCITIFGAEPLCEYIVVGKQSILRIRKPQPDPYTTGNRPLNSVQVNCKVEQIESCCTFMFVNARCK